MSQAKVWDKHTRFAGKRVLTVASAQVNLFKDTDLLQLCRTPPLIRYFSFFTSHLWFLGRSASSCTQLPPRLLFLAPHPKVLQPVCGPLKRRGTSKGFFFFFFFSQGSVDTSISEPSLSFGLQVEWRRRRRRWNPFGSLCVRAGGKAKALLVFPAETAPRLKLSHWSYSRQHVPPQPLLSMVLYEAFPCRAMPCQSTLALLYVRLAQTGACVSDLVCLKGLAACSPCGDNPSAPRPFFFSFQILPRRLWRICFHALDYAVDGLDVLMVVVAGRLTPMAGLQLGQAVIYSSKLFWIFVPTERQAIARSSIKTQHLSV